ncbi:stage III sporulation protein AE [Defluviitalea phaphyphila]|uniref:stage III sporulation protein AE n=1 Tax=Defluviitalea phaphyphila TaxID=1473580 RepID=UPI000731BC28|nr:stage III sporulation protein AE [Defluviitalea phaphyphila]
MGIQKIFIIFFIILIMPQCIYGEQVEELLDKQLENINFSSIEDTITKIKNQTENPYLEKFSFKEIVTKAVKGEIDFSIHNIIKGIIALFTYEVKSYIGFIGKLLIISMFCALLSNLAESFQSKSTSQVGFYVCYMVIIILLLQSFQIALQVSSSAIENMVLIMQSAMPMLLSLMMTSGAVTTGTIFEPVILLSIQTIAMFISELLLPIIFLTVVLAIINSLSKKEVLKKMLELFWEIIDWILKGLTTLFIGIMAIHGLTTPILDGVVNNTAKQAVETFIPIVGKTLTGAVDIVMNCSMLIKNAVGVGAIILLCIYCVIPLIKMTIFLFIYKIIAALIQPISEKRIVECISNMGEACTRLFTSIITVNILFIISITILVGVGNMVSMIR